MSESEVVPIVPVYDHPTKVMVPWSRDVFFERGAVVVYNGMKFECLSSHVASSVMNPQYTPSHWKRVV